MSRRPPSRPRPRPRPRPWPGLATALAGLALAGSALAAEAPAVTADGTASGAAAERAAAAAPATLAVCADPANLPYSDAQAQGFENRIATLLADELHATLRYTWNLQRRSFLRRTLLSGACDVVLGLPATLQGVLLTRPYYQSSYVFVSRRDRSLQLQGFDDPALRTLRIGLQAVGAEGANTPPAMALARRGIVDHITGFPVWGDEADETPQRHIIDAVAAGDIDVAIVWGPFAGYFAQAHGGALQITPVAGDPRQPALAFQYAMAAGVRRGDTALRDAVQQVLDRRAGDIQAILQAYGVPLGPPGLGGTTASHAAVTATATQRSTDASNRGPAAASSGE